MTPTPQTLMGDKAPAPSSFSPSSGAALSSINAASSPTGETVEQAVQGTGGPSLGSAAVLQGQPQLNG